MLARNNPGWTYTGQTLDKLKRSLSTRYRVAITPQNVSVSCGSSIGGNAIVVITLGGLAYAQNPYEGVCFK